MMFLTLVLTALLSLAAAAPYPASLVSRQTDNCRAETKPWSLSRIEAFAANPNSTHNSTISFHFCDTSPSLEFDTECKRTAAGSVVDPDTYYPCDNSTVRFIYTGSQIYVERSYINPCNDPTDPNYWTETAFGNNQTAFHNKTTPHGVKSTEKRLAVQITALTG